MEKLTRTKAAEYIAVDVKKSARERNIPITMDTVIEVLSRWENGNAWQILVAAKANHKTVYRLATVRKY